MEEVALEGTFVGPVDTRPAEQVELLRETRAGFRDHDGVHPRDEFHHRVEVAVHDFDRVGNRTAERYENDVGGRAAHEDEVIPSERDVGFRSEHLECRPRSRGRNRDQDDQQTAVRTD